MKWVDLRLAIINMAKREGIKKQEKEKSKNYIFDIIKDIKVYKKSDLLNANEYEKAFDKFMVMRFLSMNDDICEIINYVNDIQDILSKKQLYKLLIEIVPVTKSYDPYIKSDRADVEDAVKQVAEYYQCSIKDASEYVNIMGVERKRISSRLSSEITGAAKLYSSSLTSGS